MQIKVLLGKELAQKFLQIKEEYGIKSNTETIRYCINKEYKSLFGNLGNKPRQI